MCVCGELKTNAYLKRIKYHWFNFYILLNCYTKEIVGLNMEGGVCDTLTQKNWDYMANDNSYVVEYGRFVKGEWVAYEDCSHYPSAIEANVSVSSIIVDVDKATREYHEALTAEKLFGVINQIKARMVSAYRDKTALESVISQYDTIYFRDNHEARVLNDLIKSGLVEHLDDLKSLIEQREDKVRELKQLVFAKI